jgi:Major tropism determinant N-terminal domain
MAIVQISQIKHRRGLSDNGPANGLQLASAELGWDVDTQRLYIGNGTLDEGAPAVGNTEILTMASAGRGDIPGLPSTSKVQLSNNVSTATTFVSFQGPFTGVPSANVQSGVLMNYSITRYNDVRTGLLRISQINGNVAYDEEYSETANIGITFTVTGNPTFGNAAVKYTSSNTGNVANLVYVATTLTY